MFFHSFLAPLRGRIISSKTRSSLALAALLLPVILAFLSGPVSAHEYKAGSLTIVHPWSRATPVGAKAAGGYLVIRNSGQAADRLVAVSAEISPKAEIHEMAIKDNVMQMRMLENGIEIPANGEVVLKPGSFHLMFMEPARQTKEGETFKGSLTFEKAGKIDVIFNVEAMGAGKAPAGGHDMHKGH